MQLQRTKDQGQRTKDHGPVMAIDHSAMHLGKRPKRHDPRTLKLARYMTGTLPPAPSQVDYAHGIADWGMMLNDKLGCCTIPPSSHATRSGMATTPPTP
jgi:hypothetical protein